MRKRIGVVGRQNRDDGLADDRASVKHGRHEVYGRAVHAATRINSALMRVEAREKRQKGRMNVENLPLELRDEALRQNAHEAREHDHGRLVAADDVREFGFKGLARIVGLVVHGDGVDARSPGDVEPSRLRAVGNDRRNACVAGGLPVFLAARSKDRLEVAAAAGDKNYDVLHSGVILNQRPCTLRTGRKKFSV